MLSVWFLSGRPATFAATESTVADEGVPCSSGFIASCSAVHSCFVSSLHAVPAKRAAASSTQPAAFMPPSLADLPGPDQSGRPGPARGAWPRRALAVNATLERGHRPAIRPAGGL